MSALWESLSIPVIGGRPVLVIDRPLDVVELTLKLVVLLELLLGLDIGVILIQHRLGLLVVLLITQLLVKGTLLDEISRVNLGLRGCRVGRGGFPVP